MRRYVPLAVTCCILGCEHPLPSAVPLGTGPLAGEPVSVSAAPRQNLGAITRQDEPDSDDSTDDSDKPAQEDKKQEAPNVSDAKKPASTDEKAADAGTHAKPEIQAPKTEVAGRYEGNDVTIIRWDGAPEQREDDPNAKTDVAETKQGVDITIVNSRTLEPICTLHASRSGSQAVLDSGQPCFGFSVQNGTGTFASKRLRFEMQLEGDGQTDQGKRHATVEYRFEGERK